MVTIYVRLLDENVDVKRPVQAKNVERNVYRIVSQPYDRDTEKWEFEPGDRVVCETTGLTEGNVLLAVRLADSPAE